MKRFLAVALCLVLAIFALNTSAFALQEPVAFVPPDLENLMVFGDSLSDSGNLFTLYSGTNPDTEDYWQGRFSNGPVWSEVMANFMGTKNTYLLAAEPETVPPRRLLVTENPPVSFYATPFFYNNAYGGANTSVNFTHFGWQINAWQAEGLTIPDKTLVVVWIGGNDFLGMQEGDDPATVVANAVNNIYSGLEDIADLGATHIAVCNLPNLGDTPRYNATPQKDAVTQLTVSFNIALAAALQDFMFNFPGVNVYPIDMFAMSEATHANPGLYGVTNLVDGALYEGETFDSADGYLYWDGVHPTRAAHEQLAAKVYGTVFIGAANANYIKTKGTTGDTIGIEGANCNVTSVQFGTVADTEKTGRPSNLLYGLLDITATLEVAGDVAQITVYLPKALPAGYSWYKYCKGEWVDFAQVFEKTWGMEGAQISADRKQVTLRIQDDGWYDADRARGFVQDPICAGVLVSDKPKDAGKDDACFVRSAQNGSTPGMPVVLLVAFLVLGLAVRRVRVR
ncbi:MAG: SGNH/GDSL hydrolase family protein [Desulfatibacillum sp.]|nr:SGNH/GDSL hydrolase family protein [Desulfatibacillum sp.]